MYERTRDHTGSSESHTHTQEIYKMVIYAHKFTCLKFLPICPHHAKLLFIAHYYRVLKTTDVRRL